MILKKIRSVHILVVINIVLMLLFWFRFSLRLYVPLNVHHFVHILILILLVISIYLSIKVSKKISTEWKRPMVSMGLIVLNLVAIFYIGSINNRETEIKNFFRENEHKLNELVVHYQNHGDDIEFTRMEKALNIRLVYSSGGYHFTLYDFLSYGYRILYTIDTKDIIPKSPGGSPTSKWFRVNEHWYYYSIFD